MKDELKLPLTIIGESGQYAIDDARGKEITGWIESEHAAHIVRAVNNHYILLQALTEARARMLDMMQQDDGQAYKEAEKAMPMIDEALAAARGEL